MTAVIAVVIPYFQREAGILRRALASVAAQHACPLPIHVVVVDDASPADAQAEVDAAGPLPMRVQVVKRPNGGPGAARNTALDLLAAAPPEAAARYVAFLDSDDEWTPDHLARAVAALDAGHDLYFSDFHQLGSATGAFDRAGRIVPRNHPALPAAPMGLHHYAGDMLDQIITGNVIGTSTVVYAQGRFPGVRFRTEYRNAGEDYLFWLDLTRAGARIAFSSRAEVSYGRGVNIYAGSGWGTEPHLRRLHDEIRFRRLTRRRYATTAAQRAHIGQSLATLRTAFAADLLHRLGHRRGLPAGLLMSHLLLDPLSFVMLLPNATRLLTKRI